jgi:hypothetical protein
LTTPDKERENTRDWDQIIRGRGWPRETKNEGTGEADEKQETHSGPPHFIRRRREAKQEQQLKQEREKQK